MAAARRGDARCRLRTPLDGSVFLFGSSALKPGHMQSAITLHTMHTAPLCLQVYSGDGVSIKNTLPVPLSWTGLEYPRFQLEVGGRAGRGRVGGQAAGGRVGVAASALAADRRPTSPPASGPARPRCSVQTYSMLKIPQLTTRYSVQRDGLRRGVPSSLGCGRLGAAPVRQLAVLLGC